jgi:hypothetical protein
MGSHENYIYIYVCVYIYIYNHIRHLTEIVTFDRKFIVQQIRRPMSFTVRSLYAFRKAYDNCVDWEKKQKMYTYVYT